MPRRTILSTAEKESLLSLPETQGDLIRQYTFSEYDLAIVNQHRGPSKRLGFAVQLCYMRYPGIVLGPDQVPAPSILELVSRQLKINPSAWQEYAARPGTRREHLLELQSVFGFKTFTMRHYRTAINDLDKLVKQTDKGIHLACTLLQSWRSQQILLPSINVIERICAQALTNGNRDFYKALTEPLSREHFKRLDRLLKLKDDGPFTTMVWLRQSPLAPNARQMIEHIERLKTLQALDLPEDIGKKVHQNRLLKVAREGSRMTPNDLAKFETERRYATLVAIALETTATVTDEIIHLHDRILGVIFNRAKHNHQEQFQESGKAINNKLRLLCLTSNAVIAARETGSDPYKAIEDVLSWNDFIKCVQEAMALIQSEDFDYLHRLMDSYSQIRRYSPSFLEVLNFKATSEAQPILDAVEILKSLNTRHVREIPANAPRKFVRQRWTKLIFTDAGIDRPFYEICTLSELNNSLISGDIWVEGSRDHKDFEDYLLDPKEFITLKNNNELPLNLSVPCDKYVEDKLRLLEERLATIDGLAQTDNLPDTVITTTGFKITPLTNSVPDEAANLMSQVYSLLPHIKITELLLDVDEWTGFTKCFMHMKSNETARDKMLLLTAILADGINLGLTKMAESCPSTTYAKLSRLQAWYVREDTYQAALDQLVNAQLEQPFAANWGDGTTSSSDGQRFRVGGHAEAFGNINPKYGSDPGLQFYTHVSDVYSPFKTKLMQVGMRDATHVLDGLLYNGSKLRLRIKEHFVDTLGQTDQVFALMPLLDFRLSPRIRDLKDKKLYVPDSRKHYSTINPLIGGSINVRAIQNHWNEILRLATSIKQGTVMASLMLRKLANYPRQNGLAVALKELGKIERTLFTLNWLQDAELRRRVQAGLNKGEARNALARAVFFNRMGEVRDRNFENQRFRASGLTLVTAAIILWNTVYVERAINALKANGRPVDDSLFQYLSPLGWEHINLTGDYVWKHYKRVNKGQFRSLRPLSRA